MAPRRRTRERIRVVECSETGRNKRFHDTRTGWEMSRAEFVRRIKAGEYQGYHVRCINGVDTPVSNPDLKRKNNLG